MKRKEKGSKERSRRIDSHCRWAETERRIVQNVKVQNALIQGRSRRKGSVKCVHKDKVQVGEEKSLQLGGRSAKRGSRGSMKRGNSIQKKRDPFTLK